MLHEFKHHNITNVQYENEYSFWDLLSLGFNHSIHMDLFYVAFMTFLDIFWSFGYLYFQ